MKFPLLKYFISFLLFCTFAGSANATHLVGGSMSYEYVGRLGNGNFQYRVTLKIYRDCEASQVQFDNEIIVAAYNATGGRAIANSFTFTKLSEVSVDPPRGANCPNQPNVCLREAVYSRLIDLPPSNFGYHLVFQRCCRNTQNNILDDMGQTYYAFIPPTNIRNSSPFFTGVPAPYICVNDTTIYYNGASDPDGDSLSYKLVWPWAGASNNDPIPNPPTSIPPVPSAFPPNVVYRNGFNANFPFGVNGLASINVNNGLTTMLARGVGRYALAIEVTEWRNGVALSTIRLDVQMIVVLCDPNNKPNIAPSDGAYFRRVTAGETVCFDIIATDPDSPFQNITLSAKGEVFGGAGWKGPVGTFGKKTARRSVTSQFCWTPSCDQVRGAPYNFVAEAIDDGCPPKSRSVTFTIQVDPFLGQKSFLSAPTILCEGDSGILYSLNNVAGHTYKWTVDGGVIIGPDNKNSITVKWGKPGVGKVRVTEFNKAGCKADPIEVSVSIAPSPAKRPIAGIDTVCEFSTNMQYQVVPEAFNKYHWYVEGGTIASTPQPYQVLVNWGAAGSGIVKMVEENTSGCLGDTNYFYVTKMSPDLDTLYGSPSVCPNIKGVEYYVTPVAGATYQWFVTGGTIHSGNGTAKITVDWGDIGTGMVKAVETLKWGCVGDTVYFKVKKGYALDGMVPIGDDSVCEFSSGLKYEVIQTKGSKYFWTVTGGTEAKDDTTSYIIVNWGGAGNGLVEVYETSYDSLNNKPCISLPAKLPVVINPLPVANIIDGQFELCQSSGTYQYTLNGYAGSTYVWAINGDSSKIKGQGTKTISVDWSLDGKFVLSVQEITKDSCVSFVVDSAVLVNPRPKTTPIIGDSIVCHPFYQNHTYTTTGFATSNFNWWVNSGTITTGTGTNTVNIDWSGQQNNTVKVLEISDKGCPGDTFVLNVFADYPVLKMRYVTVGFPQDDHMDIHWELANAPRFNSTFTVQRRIPGVPDSWKDVGTVTKNNLTFTEKNLNTDKTPYEYRIKAKDLCGNTIFSDIHTSILLTGNALEDYSVSIDWTRYKGWTDGVRNYEVYRSLDFDPAFSLTNDKGSDTTDLYADGFKNFTQRYRIKAYENRIGGDTSWSNEIFFNFDPVIWVPNAFTPNDDALNKKFKIVYMSIKTFHIDIYDRWGELLFSTDNIENQWDGTFRGKMCPDGVYIYRLQYTGANNINKILMGNITLLR